MLVKFTKIQRVFFAKLLADAQAHAEIEKSYAYGFGYLESALERISQGEECYFDNKENKNV